MKQSQQIAAAVALRAARPQGHDRGDRRTRHGHRRLGSPAVGSSQPTDVIVAIDGKQVRTPADVTAAMSTKHVGDTVSFTVQRGGTPKVVRIDDSLSRPWLEAPSDRSVHRPGLPHPPADPGLDRRGRRRRPIRGARLRARRAREARADVDHGHKIAATGEIFLNGTVGPIGGIKQKTIGAREAGVDAFLVPAGENARDARKYAHGLRIIPVKSFQQALHALATLPADA